MNSRWILGAAALLVACGAEPGGSSTEPQGSTTEELVWNTDLVYVPLKYTANPAITDVIGAFQRIPTTGTRMGFQSGPLAWDSRIYGSSTSHWEGLGRLRGPYLIASSNAQGELNLVQLASEPGVGRWTSNRPTGGLPPASDTIVPMNGLPTLRLGFGGYTHLGGLSVIGDYVIVGLEREGDSHSDSTVFFYDFSTPTSPRLVWGFYHGASTAGALAMTRTPSGQYLIGVGGWGSSTIDFYLSSTTDIESPGLSYARRWTASTDCRNLIAYDSTCFASYQNLNFVTDANGRLFLLGTNRTGSGEDWLDLFEVTGVPYGTATSLSNLVITKIGKKHMYCVDGCSFAAGATAYVDGSSNSIIVYATEMRRTYSSTGLWTKLNQF